MSGKLVTEIDNIIKFVEESFQDSSSSSSQSKPAPAKKAATKAASGPTSYKPNFHTLDTIKNGQTVYITADLKHLRKEWDESDVGPIDDGTLKAYLCQEAKVVEIEEDDETIKARWINYDSQWMPIKACSTTPTGPCSGPPMLSHLDEAESKPAPVELTYLAEETAKVGMRVWVTPEFDRLKKEWANSELGGIDDDTLKGYTRVEGKILEIEEDDESAQVQWTNYDTQWIPLKALTTTELPNPKGAPMLGHMGGDEEEAPKNDLAARQAAVDQSKVVYLDAEEDVKMKMIVWVTVDFKRLRREWDESEVGPMDDDDLKAYLGCRGEVTEIEEDDETVQLKWDNYDTQWLPWKACTLTEMPNNGPPMLGHLGGEDGNDQEDAGPEKPGWWNTISYKSAGTIQKKSTLWVGPDIDKLKAEFEKCNIKAKPDAIEYLLCQECVVNKYNADKGTTSVKWVDKKCKVNPIPIAILTQTRMERPDQE